MAGHDPFRQMPVRLLGYGVPVGDLLSMTYGDVNASPFYLVGEFFIWGHCFHRALRAYNISENRFMSAFLPCYETNAVVALFDTFIWEVLASYLIPSLTSTCVYWLVDSLLSGSTRSRSHRPIPFLFALITIPLLRATVDQGVDRLMHELIRPMYATKGDILASF
ncbi:mitochondrial fission process protein 1-like [Physella acuta]|uniref:mitochondrial fission process protein 1-like n=1 Tax=Physella acuta TaxID=109671 RepID=UPI0027DCCCF5|nr:mitochondrial fission process protein 1-like [Physella acuta]